MKYEVKIPAVGESITEATIGQWMKKSGEAVKQNEVLMLIETDKASVEVVAEQSGVLTTTAEQGATLPIGAVVGSIDTDGKGASAGAPATAAASAPATSAPAPSSAAATTNAAPASNGPAPAPSAPSNSPQASSGIAPELQSHLSPAVQRVVTERGVDPASVNGTGKDGRLTKADVINAPAGAPAAASAPAAPAAAKPAAAPAPIVLRGPSKQGDQKRVPMTTIRKKIAERLVQSQQTTATLTTFNEIDMSKVMELRAKYKDKFKDRYGIGLGFMGFFVKASIEALKDIPAANAFINGTDLIFNNYYNIGMAVGTEKGLIVPVIKDADMMSIAQIESSIRNFALKGRDGKISIDDLSGGTFTITNGGTYGSMMSTPILNPPQSGILGLHKIEDRPVAINGKVEIRPMMYVALSYDHRVIDGKEAVTFLVKVKEMIEDPERMFLEV